MAATRNRSNAGRTAATSRLQQQQQLNGKRGGQAQLGNCDDGDGQQWEAYDGWSAHARYFLARYPLETRHFVAQVRVVGLLVLVLLSVAMLKLG